MERVKKAIIITFLLWANTSWACDGCSEQIRKYGITSKELRLLTVPDEDKNIDKWDIVYRAILGIHHRLDNLQEQISDLKPDVIWFPPQPPISLLGNKEGHIIIYQDN